MSKDIAKEIKTFSESIKPQKNILDVGCGLRPYESFFKQCSYTGIDVEKSGRAGNDKKPDKFYDGLNIPFDNDNFDIVLCTEVLEHCVNPDKLLSEIYRVLKKEGILFLTVPFIWGEHEIPYDFRRYSSFGIKKEIESKGFRIIDQKKLTNGIKSIELLVNSEIGHYKNTRTIESGTIYKFKEVVLYYCWRTVLRLWNSLYKFNRVYIHNLIVAEK